MPEEKLRKYWKELEPNNERNVLAVMASEDCNRAVGVSMMRTIFPDQWEMLEACSSKSLREMILSEMKGRVALALAIDDGDESEDQIANNFLHEDNLIPVVLVTDEVPHIDRPPLLDGVIDMPLRMDTLKRCLSVVLAKDNHEFESEKNEIKAGVLGEFVGYYLNLVPIWIKNIAAISFSSESGKVAVPGSDTELLAWMTSSTQELFIVIQNFQEALDDKPSEEQLFTFIHKLNSKISPMVSCPELISEDGMADEKDRRILGMLENEANQMVRHVKAISEAAQGKISWREVDEQKMILQLREKLTIPEGTRVCVIDNESGILFVAYKVIEMAGGQPLVATDKKNLEDLICGVRNDGSRPEIQVFLLDNDLDHGVKGHELIPLIKKFYPEALIIGHTSDALAINTDLENPYRRAGVEVVGKREWGAVSGVIRRKLGKVE